MRKRCRGASTLDKATPQTESDTPVHSNDTSSGNINSSSKQHLVWASYIKGHHQRVREAAKSDFGGDAVAAWEAMLRDEASLDTYATAMHHLATQYWDAPAQTMVLPQSDVAATSESEPSPSTSGECVLKYRYDDRIQQALMCAQQYFIGPVPGNGSNGEDGVAEYTPRVVTMALKHAKRNFYQLHQRQMSDSEQVLWVDEWLRAAPERSALRKVRQYYDAMYAPQKAAATVAIELLDWLDVGSCYAPFEGKVLQWFTPRGESAGGEPPSKRCQWDANVLPLKVSSIDLAPYKGSSVAKCDWLSVPVIPASPGDPSCIKIPVVIESDAAATPADGEHVRVAKAIHGESCDVVCFSLVLSYMPTPRMRFDAVRKALDVLRDYGLLIIISTRTQGPRQAAWIEDWVRAVESVGFTRVHKIIQCRLVVLSFQKDPRQSRQLPQEDDDMAALMTITADAL